MTYKYFLGGAVLLALSTSAFAASPVTGTVNVDGYVTSSCTVAGTTPNGGLWGTIHLLELDGAGGTLNSALAATTSGSHYIQASVTCNSSNPTITMTATPLTDGAGATAGYTSTINYRAQLDAALAPSGNFETTYLTSSGVQTPTGPAAVGSPLSTSLNNITVGVNSLSTVTPTDILTVGNYTATISITISPT